MLYESHISRYAFLKINILFMIAKYLKQIDVKLIFVPEQ